MINKSNLVMTTVFLVVLISAPARAALVGVNDATGSNVGTYAQIIGAPSDALDDIVTNTGMEGFDEAQGVTTSVAHAIDGGGFIAAGTVVDSHMIFLNSLGTDQLIHENVEWVFDGIIIGVMSDTNGLLEAASTFELGNPATNYTVGAGGTPFNARGLELPIDSYSIAGNTLTVTMRTIEPGDWMRVVTVSPIPVPAAVWLFASGLIGLIGIARRKTAA